MLCFPNCKINLGLYVTELRGDGYHNIETVFYPVRCSNPSGKADMLLHDVLEVAQAAQTRLHMSGLPVAGNETDNLVMRAYRLLKGKFPSVVKELDIYLHKTIPMGSGLGGGSADGAFMLRLLNDYFKLNLNQQELADMALQLGSDCPFFIYNTPQFATGRGEQMNDVNVDLSAYSLQVICPRVHISTAKAFSLITPQPAAFDLRRIREIPVEQWKGRVNNDFEAPVFKQYPVLAEIKQQLYDYGALYASMSGSGSAIYGIFVKEGKAEVKVGVGFEGFYME